MLEEALIPGFRTCVNGPKGSAEVSDLGEAEE